MNNLTDHVNLLRQDICDAIRYAFEREASAPPEERAMNIYTDRCPFCGNATTKERLSMMKYHVNCPICGWYTMTGSYSKKERTLKIVVTSDAKAIIKYTLE